MQWNQTNHCRYKNKIVIARISIGEFKGKIVFLPRLPLIPSDSGL